MTKERLVDVLKMYAGDDIEIASEEFVREKLENICGCSEEEIAEILED